MVRIWADNRCADGPGDRGVGRGHAKKDSRKTLDILGVTKQGTAPTGLARGRRASYCRKRAEGESEKGEGSSIPSVQPGSPTSYMGRA